MLFPPIAVVEKKGFRLGVIGLGAMISDPEYREQIRYIPPQKAIADSLASFPKIWILLSPLDPSMMKKPISSHKKIWASLPCLTTRGAALEDPQNNEQTKTLIIETPNVDGMYKPSTST